MAESFDVNDNSDVYYTGTYWNDFEVVRSRINERISGKPTTQWFEHFASVTGRVFSVPSSSIANGWVERDLVAHGLVEEAVGIDYSTDLLETARPAASESGLPLTYCQANINDAVLPDFEFDLVVNHAAAHHIAAIDRVFREVCRILPEGGSFVSFDYVGPHRNQYRTDAWDEAWSSQPTAARVAPAGHGVPPAPRHAASRPNGGDPFRTHRRDLPPLLRRKRIHAPRWGDRLSVTDPPQRHVQGGRRRKARPVDRTNPRGR